jgi:type IX secretion system PorP/SprF family membrane protein
MLYIENSIKTMRELYIAIVLLLVPNLCLSQQDPQFTFNNDFNSYSIPSFMVNEYKLNATVQHRQQWVGFDGRPITTLVNASYRIDKAWSAVGVSVLSDILGAQYTGGALINYAFDGKIGEHHLIPGIQMGLLYNVLDGSQLDPIQENDPNIITSKRSGIAFDLGLSLAYRYRGLAVGFGANHLTGPTIDFNEGGNASQYTVARHIYGLIAYEGRFGQFRFKPISFVKTDFASTQFDQFLWLGACNLTKVFDGVSAGVGYRIDDAVMVGLELAFKWFTLGYSYDITTSGLRNYSDGSHEAYLRVHIFKTQQKDSQEID